MKQESRLFVPLLDNGNGQVMAAYMMDFVAAFEGRNVQMARASDSHAGRGMNKVANAFLATDCDTWINIDADIRFTKKDVDRLLSHDLPLVYGIYPKKQEDTQPCVCTFSEVPLPDENGLVEVRRSGRGFMLVKREVLEAMKEDNGGPALRYHNHDKIEWDFFPSGVVFGDKSAFGHELVEHKPKREWLSEDWYFCERARALGFKTMVDTQIALGHVGLREYRFTLEQVTRVDGWHGIPGWFTDADAEVYRKIAKALPVAGKVAEIGTWMGRSLGALITFCREEGKSPAIHAIDTFKGTLSEGDAHLPIVAAHGGSIRGVFEENMKKLGANGEVTVHEAESLTAAQKFSAGDFDAIFIDGDHTFDAVNKDVAAWLPKVKRGGIIAGHDYDYPEVAEALHGYISPAQIERIGRCWYHVKRDGAVVARLAHNQEVAGSNPAPAIKS